MPENRKDDRAVCDTDKRRLVTEPLASRVGGLFVYILCCLAQCTPEVFKMALALPSFVPRVYQQVRGFDEPSPILCLIPTAQEIFKKAQEGNVICAMETGAGKARAKPNLPTLNAHSHIDLHRCSVGTLDI